MLEQFVLKNMRTGEYLRLANKHDTYNITLATKFTFGTKRMASAFIRVNPAYKLIPVREKGIC